MTAKKKPTAKATAKTKTAVEAFADAKADLYAAWRTFTAAALAMTVELAENPPKRPYSRPRGPSPLKVEED